MIHDSKSPKNTKELGHFLLNHIYLNTRKNALVIGLEGELGAGKTTFVQGLAHILGIKAKVKSPTFNLMKKYPIPKTKNQELRTTNFLYHLDCYRLKDHNDLLVLGIKDILKDKDNVLVIEWPEKVKKILPKKYIKIKIEHVSEGQRKIKINF